jgi:hypothetical protein
MENVTSAVQKALKVLNNSIEFLDECFWKAAGIKNDIEQEKIEQDVVGYVTTFLMDGDLLKNVNEFEKRTSKQLLFRGGYNSNCGSNEECKALKKFCHNVRELARLHDLAPLT